MAFDRGIPAPKGLGGSPAEQGVGGCAADDGCGRPPVWC